MRLAAQKKVGLDQLTAQDYLTISSDFGDDVSLVYNFQQSVDSRNAPGGTGSQAVLAQIKMASENPEHRSIGA